MSKKLYHKLLTILGAIAIIILLFCLWQVDARDNRVEANTYLICVKEVGVHKCFHGRFTDPYPGL